MNTAVLNSLNRRLLPFQGQGHKKPADNLCENKVSFQYLVRDAEQQPAAADNLTQHYWENGNLVWQKLHSILQDKERLQEILASDEQFTDFLHTVHCLLATGLETLEGGGIPRLFYRRPYGRDQLLSLEKLKLGQFREANGHALTHCSHGTAMKIAELAKQYGDPYTYDIDASPGESVYLDRDGFYENKRYKQCQRVDLPGMAEEDSPFNNIPRYYYPRSEAIPKYFRQMRLVLREIMLAPVSHQDVMLQKISLFYQYAANARPFPMINNSLFMLITNALLIQQGLEGISHGELDYCAQSLQPVSFSALFCDAVRAAQHRPRFL